MVGELDIILGRLILCSNKPTATLTLKIRLQMGVKSRRFLYLAKIAMIIENSTLTHLIKLAWVLLATYSSSLEIEPGILPSEALVIDEGSIGLLSIGILA